MNGEPQFKTPGQLIEHLLAERVWNKRILAIVVGIDETTLSKVISGKRPLDAKTALALSEVFDRPAKEFMDLQQSYDLDRARYLSIPDPDRAKRARMYGGLPVAELIKRGWLSDVDNVRDAAKVQAAINKFFNVDSFEQIEASIPAHAAKKTNVGAQLTLPQLAWFRRVWGIASEMIVPRYSVAAARDAISELKALRASAESIRKVPRILAECGIRYVIVESLAGAKIDGVCFWLNPGSPVIGMSLRFDRIDNFWFVLRHECEHVLKGHGQSSQFGMFDIDLIDDKAGVGDGIDEEEQIANQAAADFCVPQSSLEAFIARKAPFFAERDVIGFSRTLGIHPGLLAGQLHRRTKCFNRFREHLVKIRSIVAPSATVDGWCDVAPVDQ
jgi:HTH-type transcriptional regulator/antitoxin HigA